MKGYRKLLISLISVCTVILVHSGYIVKANDSGQFIKGVSTAYCLKGITASGEETKEGYCAGSKNYLGKIIKIYQRLPDDSVGKYLGTFICNDTGKTKAIQNGFCIDVWMPDMELCQKWMDKVYANGCNGRIYFQIIEKN